MNLLPMLQQGPTNPEDDTVDPNRALWAGTIMDITGFLASGGRQPISGIGTQMFLQAQQYNAAQKQKNRPQRFAMNDRIVSVDPKTGNAEVVWEDSSSQGSWKTVGSPKDGIYRTNAATGEIEEMMPPVNPKTGFFEGSSMQAQALNQHIMSLPEDQRGQAALSLSRQYLESPQTITTPEGTYVRPGFNLGGGAPQAVPQAAPQGQGFIPKPTSDAERLALGYHDRMLASHQGLAEMENYVPGGFESFWGELAPEAMKGEDFKRFRGFKDDFISAVLRKESGAAISDAEYTREERKYFPMPGDSAEIVSDKRARRERAIANMGKAAGPAYQGGGMKESAQFDQATYQANPIPGASWEDITATAERHGITPAEVVDRLRGGG